MLSTPSSKQHVPVREWHIALKWPTSIGFLDRGRSRECQVFPVPQQTMYQVNTCVDWIGQLSMRIIILTKMFSLTGGLVNQVNSVPVSETIHVPV